VWFRPGSTQAGNLQPDSARTRPNRRLDA
jgi:hypothetical protein